MKYEVPEINISKFSVENIVTVSAAAVAETAINEAIAAGKINGVAANSKIVKTSMDQWVVE